MKDSFTKFVSKHRLRPYHLAICVLFVGWAPSLLLAYYSYTVLGRTLEAKSMADAESLVRSLSQHVETELERTGETMDYYRTLPVTANLLQPGSVPTPPPVAAAASAISGDGLPKPARKAVGAPTLPRPPRRCPSAAAHNPAPAGPQEWLASIFYPQKRIDGMFLTDRVRSSRRRPCPNPAASDQEKHGEFSRPAPWKDAAEKSSAASFVVSPVYLRASPTAGSLTSVVVAVRDPASARCSASSARTFSSSGSVSGCNGVEMVNPIETNVQILDQDAHALFDHGNLKPNVTGQDGTRRETAPPACARKKSGTKRNRRQILHLCRHRHDRLDPPAQPSGAGGPRARAGFAARNAAARRHADRGHDVRGGVAQRVLPAAAFASSLRVEREQIFSEKILANMPVGIALVDPAGERFLQANSTFTEIVCSLGGLPREWDVTRRRCSRMSGVASREALARVLHFGVPFQAIEQRTPTANGQVRYLTTNLLRLQDNQQRTMGVLCLVEDSTAAVTLRQELLNANASKDQFLAQLSHELRNPLSPVITMVAELEAFRRNALPAARLPLEIIRRNVELEARLIDDLLDVTRISSGKLQLNRQTIDVHRTLRLALEICQRDIDDKRLRVQLELNAREHYADADPARLQQIFWNLIKNAVKFTPEGRRITVRSANLSAGSANAVAGQAHVQLPPAGESNGASDSSVPGKETRPGGFLRVEVADEGIGDRVATPAPDFQRLRSGAKLDHATLRRPRSGAGDFQGDGRGAQREPEGG